MSIHVRTQIRQAVQARIIAANTACADRIFLNRMQSVWETELPCILVYTEQETSDVRNVSPREYERDLEVSLEVVAEADDTLDDTLDSICADLEQCLFTDETFGDLVVDTILKSTSLAILEAGEKSLGAAKLTLSMIYYSMLPAEPAGELSPFNGVNSTIQTPDRTVVLSEDEINLTGGSS